MFRSGWGVLKVFWSFESVYISTESWHPAWTSPEIHDPSPRNLGPRVTKLKNSKNQTVDETTKPRTQRKLQDEGAPAS